MEAKDNIKDKILIEGRRVEEDSLYSSKGHFYAAQFWTNFHLWIGIPAAVLAAVAGVTALSDHEIIAGILAIIVSALGAISTFINPNEKANTHHNAGNQYNALKNRSRIFCEIDTNMKTEEELLKNLQELSKLRDELNDGSPQIPKWAFQKARKGIEEGEAHYKVDKS